MSACFLILEPAVRLTVLRPFLKTCHFGEEGDGGSRPFLAVTWRAAEQFAALAAHCHEFFHILPSHLCLRLLELLLINLTIKCLDAIPLVEFRSFQMVICAGHCPDRDNITSLNEEMSVRLRFPSNVSAGMWRSQGLNPGPCVSRTQARIHCTMPRPPV